MRQASLEVPPPLSPPSSEDAAPIAGIIEGLSRSEEEDDGAGEDAGPLAALLARLRETAGGQRHVDVFAAADPDWGEEGPRQEELAEMLAPFSFQELYERFKQSAD
jgi:hypothetical protein